MPIYAYKCTECGAEEEHIQSFDDPPAQSCERCEGKLERLLTSAAFHLKGGGWYADGYASSGGSEDAAGNGESTGDSTSSSDATESSAPADKSSASPATATETKPKPKPKPSKAKATKKKSSASR